MNSVLRMLPGVDRLFFIVVPDLDVPFGTAGHDLAIVCEYASPDSAAMLKGANQIMGFRLPESGRFICAGREDVLTIRTENGRVGFGEVADGLGCVSQRGP